MKPRALVVEDDAGVMPTIEDTMFSMGHEHTWAMSQFDAQGALTDDEFDYVLLDLAIPARPDGDADKQYGINLLDYISQGYQLPVIIMTAYLADCVDLSNQLRDLGAKDFIAKPFQNRGRELANKIRKLLSKSGSDRDRRKRETPSEPPQFSGGALAFFDDRVELMGVKIISDRGPGTAILVLKELSRRNRHGHYVRMSGEDLARQLKTPGGVGAITSSVQTIRRNITQRLHRDLGLQVAKDGVISHDDQGYFLRDGIEVEEAVGAGDGERRVAYSKA
jgi:DNA-binding response OmpR family regulator